MKTPSTLALAGVLALGIAGCSPTGNTTAPEEADDAVTGEGFVGVTLPGTGDYAIPADAPYGGYELPENQTELPAGCTWSLYLADGSLFVENVGPFVFLTDVTVRFVTDGCPDWVQFE